MSFGCSTDSFWCFYSLKFISSHLRFWLHRQKRIVCIVCMYIHKSSMHIQVYIYIYNIKQKRGYRTHRPVLYQHLLEALMPCLSMVCIYSYYAYSHTCIKLVLIHVLSHMLYIFTSSKTYYAQWPWAKAVLNPTLAAQNAGLHKISLWVLHHCLSSCCCVAGVLEPAGTNGTTFVARRWGQSHYELSCLLRLGSW